jgi:hypothetical protein
MTTSQIKELMVIANKLLQDMMNDDSASDDFDFFMNLDSESQFKIVCASLACNVSLSNNAK